MPYTKVEREMKAIKYVSVFALGAVVAAIAMSQIQVAERVVPGTDRARGHEFSDRRFDIPVMQLDAYGRTNSGLTGPWNTAAIGPVLEVRKHLTDLQQQSLAANRRDPKQRVLVRFEITEAWIDVVHARDPFEVPVRTVLYWATSRPGRNESFSEVVEVYYSSRYGDSRVKAGAALAEVEIETKDYFVTSQQTKEYRVTAPQSGTRAFGTDGWKIAREKTISREVKKVGQYNDAVAFYDTSLLVPVK